ncbi:hypothetical protein ACDA55_36900, partial [Rhizobium ruizarguesonis]
MAALLQPLEWCAVLMSAKTVVGTPIFSQSPAFWSGRRGAAPADRRRPLHPHLHQHHSDDWTETFRRIISDIPEIVEAHRLTGN